jgi:acetylornithine deacetylase/succinyl-diaminopimelate desuccinylase-like protein
MPISHTQRLSDSDRAAIKAAAIELLADAIQFLKDLTDINTSNPPGLNYPEIASVLDKFLSSKGYDVEQVAIPPQLHPELVPFSDLPRLNVFARLKQCSGLQYSSLTAAWCLKQIGEDFQ